MWLSSLNPEFTAEIHINFKKTPHFSTKARLTVLLIEALWERDLRWVSGISRISHGKEDIRQTLIDAEFIEGGTVGPAPKE